MFNMHEGNFPTIIEFLYPSLNAALPVPVLISLLFKKKNCILRLGLAADGFET